MNLPTEALRGKVKPNKAQQPRPRCTEDTHSPQALVFLGTARAPEAMARVKPLACTSQLSFTGLARPVIKYLSGSPQLGCNYCKKSQKKKAQNCLQMPFSFSCFSISFFKVNNVERKITQAGASCARLTQFQSLSAIPDPPCLHLAQTCTKP